MKKESTNEIIPGTKVKIKYYSERPGFWARDGSMDRFMNRILTVKASLDNSRYSMCEAGTWIFRREDFDPMTNPNYLFLMKKGNKR